MKSRTGLVAAVMSGVLCALSGCAQMIEANAIESFTLALNEQNLEQLRDTTSPKFESKALRRAEALRDLQILNLPQEPPTVVDISDVNENEKDVTVQVGERGSRLLYKLKREPGTENWVVDDIYMKQRKKGLKVTKSVTEQMDLLLTVREFMEAWETGDRTDVLDVATPQFKETLAQLPPAYLQQVTSLVIGDQSGRKRSTRPEAQLDENVAIVKLPRTSGSLLMNLRLQDDGWKVADIAVDTGDPETSVSSVARTSQVLIAAVEFLDAYAHSDKQKLQQQTTSKLYRHSLLPADLSLVPLPRPGIVRGDLDVRIFGDRATYVTPFENQLVKIDLEMPGKEDGQPSAGRFLVSEVTMYEAGSQERKRLSAVFTARERMRLFVESLAARDLEMIRAISTPELNDLIWRKVDKATLSSLPIFGIIDTPPSSVDVNFQGAYTEIRTVQNGVNVQYQLQDWNGELGLHDVNFEQHGFPTSLRTRLELYLPVLEFGIATHRSDLARVKRACSEDFNRLVWAQVPSVPEIGFPISQHLQTPPTGITMQGPERAEVRLGDERWGARVALVKQRGLWVVDETLLIAGPERERRAEMKQTIRIQIANGLVSQQHAREYRAHFLGVESRTATGYVSMPAEEKRISPDELRPAPVNPAPGIQQASFPPNQPSSHRDPHRNAGQPSGRGPAGDAASQTQSGFGGFAAEADALMPPIEIPLN